MACRGRQGDRDLLVTRIAVTINNLLLAGRHGNRLREDRQP